LVSDKACCFDSAKVIKGLVGQSCDCFTAAPAAQPLQLLLLLLLLLVVVLLALLLRVFLLIKRWRAAPLILSL
jgi:hypothetical protein